MSALTKVLNVLTSHVAQPVSAAFARIPPAGQAAIKIGGRVLGGFGALVAAYKLNAASGMRFRCPVKEKLGPHIRDEHDRLVYDKNNRPIESRVRLYRSPVAFPKEATTKMAKAQAIGATIGSFLLAGAGLFFACKKY